MHKLAFKSHQGFYTVDVATDTMEDHALQLVCHGISKVSPCKHESLIRTMETPIIQMSWDI